MSYSLRSSYLCLEVWGHHIYAWRFQIIIFCLELWGHHIYVLKLLQDIIMTTSNFKTKYDDLKLPSINMMTSCFKTSIWSFLCLEVWGHYIYVLKFEVVIFLSCSLRSSYLCPEVWGRHIYVFKFEVVIFMIWSLRQASRHKYDDLKLPSINMMTSIFKT
jgi:hypothetical protein